MGGVDERGPVERYEGAPGEIVEGRIGVRAGRGRVFDAVGRRERRDILGGGESGKREQAGDDRRKPPPRRRPRNSGISCALLANPRGYKPSTAMTFAGLRSKKDIEDVIAISPGTSEPSGQDTPKRSRP